MQAKLEAISNLQKQLEESNNLLNVELKAKLDMMSDLQKDNEKIKTQLEEQSRTHQQEKDAIQLREAEKLEQVTLL